MASPPDPMSGSFPAGAPSPPSPLSSDVHLVAGIKCTVYGVGQLPRDGRRGVAVLWLLHPRLSSQEKMEPVAARAIGDWNARLMELSSSSTSISEHPGLIAVAFDQRNHGTRLVDPAANEAWRGGNPRHAQDMFSCYHGTALDVSQLITYLPAYVFPRGERDVVANSVFGVSLGGHAAWHCVLHDARIATAVSVIGCPDYTRLMMQRAEKSKLETWRTSSPPGAAFLGSPDFPPALQQAVESYDPAGLLAGVAAGAPFPAEPPSPKERQRLLPLMRRHLGGKRVLQLSGGADKLVPPACGAPFLGWLRRAAGPGGWLEGEAAGATIEVRTYEGVGHEMTPRMAADGVAFVLAGLEALAHGGGPTASPSANGSKI